MNFQLGCNENEITMKENWGIWLTCIGRSISELNNIAGHIQTSIIELIFIKNRKSLVFSSDKSKIWLD
jgi:hypothetical protein